MPSLLWLLQRAQARPRLASLKLGFERGSASTGSKEDGKPGERNRPLMGFSSSFSLFFILQFKGKNHSRRPNGSGAASLLQHTGGISLPVTPLVPISNF